MPDSTVTDRDLAGLYMARWDEAEWKTALEMLTELSAQARREGREEVVQDAARWTKEWDHREGDTMAFELVEHLENRFPLLNQPALSGAEE